MEDHGRSAGLIQVSEYDPAWPALARRAIDEVSAALPGRLAAIEHIGSTSVPGLAAKPIIDLMAAAPSLDAVVEAEDALAALASLIQRLVDAARTARGLPLVNVWEE